MEEYTFVLTIASIVVPVCATIIAAMYTVAGRVKAEHKPYIILDKIEDVSNLDRCFYFIVMLGNKLRKKYKGTALDKIAGSNDSIDVKIMLRNIGYGVATNIKFYDLESGEKIYGAQEVTDNLNQRLFTTFDIASGEEKSVQTSLAIQKEEGKIIEDTISVLCIYQDLNSNVYSFIFVIDVKRGGGYSYYACQPSSHSYKKLAKKYRHTRRKIIFDYER